MLVPRRTFHCREGKSVKRSGHPRFDRTDAKHRSKTPACRRLQRIAVEQAAQPVGHRCRCGARADVPAAARLRQYLFAAGRQARSPAAAGVRRRGHGYHPIPDAQDRARPGGAARSVQPARVGDPRRQGTTHTRTRGGAWRSAGVVRGRPRAGGRTCVVVQQPVGGRIPAER